MRLNPLATGGAYGANIIRFFVYKHYTPTEFSIL